MLTTGLEPTNQDHYTRALVWRAATAPLWAAGAALGPDGRLAFWAAAAATDLLGNAMAHPLPRRRLRSEDVAFGGEHLLERCRLFLLIALGETVLTPGSALVNTPLNATTLLSGTLAIASTLCLWWLYFRAEPIALKHVTGTRDTMYASRMAANGVMLTVAGLIVLAAGNALVIYDPSATASTATASTATVVMLFGGPILFLLAHVWYLRKVYGIVALGQLATIGALAAMGGVGLLLPAVIASLAVVVVLAGLVIADPYRGSTTP
jgi:low temperature requirement protein LtrA